MHPSEIYHSFSFFFFAIFLIFGRSTGYVSASLQPDGIPNEIGDFPGRKRVKKEETDRQAPVADRRA